MKTLSIIGSTGSIGTQTIDVVVNNPESFRVSGLAARRSWEALAKQAELLRPGLVALLEEEHYPALKARLAPLGIEVVAGMAGVIEVACLQNTDMVVSSLVGMAGLQPTLAAIELGRTIALANKETLVVGGDLMMTTARRTGSTILPVDSEHSAIFQCLAGNDRGAVERILLTASGGPFRKVPAGELYPLTAARALQHPTWNMGAKITIDSASLMNKGFEVIEACHLFEVGFDKIVVWVHPQSIIHSMVEYRDGSVLAQLGPPDMRTPIACALHYPERRSPIWSRLTLEHMRNLTFEEPRSADFPCLGLAYQAGRAGGTLPAVLNAANEVAVELFLNDLIPFGEIPVIIEKTLSSHDSLAQPGLADLLRVDAWARAHARELHKAACK